MPGDPDLLCSLVKCNPRDPPVLKLLRRVNFGTGRNFGTDVAKHYGEGSEMLVFLGKRGRKTVRRWQNSTDSCAVLFLVRKGPLGRKTTEKTRIFLPNRTPKNLGKEWKTLKKARSCLQTKKARKSRKKNKEKMIRESWCSEEILFGLHTPFALTYPNNRNLKIGIGIGKFPVTKEGGGGGIGTSNAINHD